MSTTVFYAWQSDRHQDTTRYLIRDAIKAALKKLNKDLKIQEAPSFEIDHDTKGEPGTPKIAETIAAKIRRCGAFIADVTLVTNYTTADGRLKWTPNPNVMIELGMAIRKPGWRQILLVQNGAHGSAEDLPFDLKHRSYPIQYTLKADATKDEVKKATADLARVFEAKLKAVVEHVIIGIEEQTRQHRELVEQTGRARAAETWKAFYTAVVSGKFHAMTLGAGVRLAGTSLISHPVQRRVLIGVAVMPLHDPTEAIDILSIERTSRTKLPLLGGGGFNTDPLRNSFVNYDGDSPLGKTPPNAATEITDRGVIKTARAARVRTSNDYDKNPAVFLPVYERDIYQAIGDYVQLLRSVGVSGPLEVRVCMSSTKGLYLLPDLSGFNYDDDKFRPLPEEFVLTDPATLGTDVDGKSVGEIAKAMKAAFTGLWRHAGVNDDPCFDRDGEYLEK